MVQPIVIAGPTGSGKSELAMRVAEHLGGELICADSRQLFRGMEIGSAAPTEHDKERIPHHLYGAFDPMELFDAGRFIDAADRAIETIQAKQHVPILVGGTGMYLRAWRFGMDDVPAKNAAVRDQLMGRVEALGLPSLYQQLMTIDEESALQISKNDRVRILRALEIFEMTGKKPSELRVSHFQSIPRMNATWILLSPQKMWLEERLSVRARQMFELGLVKEASLLRKHLPADHALLSTMGFAEALLLSDGKITREEAIAKTLQRQKAYAKRQMTWFKKEPWWRRVDPASKKMFQETFRFVTSE